VLISRVVCLKHARELGLDHQQALVADAGITAAGVADGPDQALAGGQAG
jgi:hypothetical protein